MGRIKLRVVAEAPVEDVYRLGMCVVDNPEMFPNIKSLTVLEKSEDGSTTTAEWTAIAKLLSLQRTITWVQVDTWSEEERCCKFCLSPDSRGNMKHLKGIWHFNSHPKGTEMLMDIDFKVQHPLATGRVHRLIDEIMRKNQQSLMKAIKKKAEEQVRDG